MAFENNPFKTKTDLIRFYLMPLEGDIAMKNGLKGYMLSDPKKMIRLFSHGRAIIEANNYLSSLEKLQLLREIDDAIIWCQDKNLENFRKGF